MKIEPDWNEQPFTALIEESNQSFNKTFIESLDGAVPAKIN